MKYREFLRQLAGETGLSLDDGHGILFGIRSGYPVTVSPTGQKKYQFRITVSVCRDGQPPDRSRLRALAKEYRQQIALCGGEKYAVNVLLKNAKKPDRAAQMVREGLDIAVSFLRENGYVSCCQTCGAAAETAAYVVNGAARQLCAVCGEKLESASDKAIEKEMTTSENTLAGIVGALLGSVLGGAVIILLSRLGYVSALSGIVMAICALKGYELLGKKMSVKGIVISCILMVGMTYAADRLDWAIIIARELDTDVFTGFRAVPLLLQEGVIESSVYYTSLFQVYAFTLVGAIWQIVVYVKGMKGKRGIAKLSAVRQTAEP